MLGKLSAFQPSLAGCVGHFTQSVHKQDEFFYSSLCCAPSHRTNRISLVTHEKVVPNLRSSFFSLKHASFFGRAQPFFRQELSIRADAAEGAQSPVVPPVVSTAARTPTRSDNNIELVVEEVDVDSFKLPHVTDYLPDLKPIINPIQGPEKKGADWKPTYEFRGKFIGDNTKVYLNIERQFGSKLENFAMVRAGPRMNCYFEPAEVKAAIVTCGGLCPGMNNVIRETVLCLKQTYNVPVVYGIQSGYRGFYDPELPPLELTVLGVKNIHEIGGTILRSSRGGFDRKKIGDFLEKEGVNMVFVIGGDGTHRGAREIFEECKERKLKTAVAGIPKTIDNDIPYIDKSFGFDTSVEEACKAINSAYMESTCFPNGIGIVNLMGRHSGFIAMHAALASRVANVCLIPEIQFQLDGKSGLLEHLRKTVLEKGNAVIVVAEGAGQDLLPDTGETDASGNKKLAKIGRFLLDNIRLYFGKLGMETSVKYVDPTYMIRSVKANPSDALYCSFLAQNAVHGAFAGFTGFTTGRVNNMYVYLPIERITGKPRTVDPNGRFWYGLMFSTQQPDFNAAEGPEDSDPNQPPCPQSWA